MPIAEEGAAFKRPLVAVAPVFFALLSGIIISLPLGCRRCHCRYQTQPRCERETGECHLHPHSPCIGPVKLSIRAGTKVVDDTANNLLRLLRLRRRLDDDVGSFGTRVLVAFEDAFLYHTVPDSIVCLV